MSIDSTASLLFNISANADDATENITRFRALMGQDLDGMTEQFSDWADEVVGKIDSVNAAMTAGVAAIAAGVLSVGMAIREATKDYTEYADEIYRATILTGMHAEDLSVLHSAAAKSNTDFATLAQGLGRFENNIVLASQGSKLQMESFAALGISQKDVIAGQKDLLPLLEKVMDGFHNNTSAVQKAAIARTLFSRGGTELIEFLSKGSEYLKENREEAEKLGLVLSTADVQAAREFKLAQTELKEESEGLAVTVGKHVVPMLEKFEAAMIAGVAATKSFAQGGLHAFQAPLVFLKEYAEEMAKIKKTVEAAGNQPGTAPPIVDPKPIKEAKTEFNGLTSIIDAMQSKVASFGTDWDKLANEVGHYHEEIDKATAELAKLQKAGTVTADSVRRETAALSRVPELIGKIVAETTDKINAAETQKWGEAVVKMLDAQDEQTAILQKAGDDRLQITREIADKEAEGDTQSYAQQRVRLEQQMVTWADSLAKKAALTAADWDSIDKITAEGLAKIDRTQTTAWQQDIKKLQEHLDATSEANASEEQKLYIQYQKELEQYSQIEEQKAIKTAQSEAQVNQIMQMYGQIRAQLLQKYQDDLQKLLNSQGFQGVFGSYFGNLIKGNQNLMRQWAASTNQSLMLVKVSLEALKEKAKQTFDQFVQGLGQTIAQAIVAKTSIVQAMEQMLKSTLESFAGQAITAAIMATAWGFYWSMLQDYTAASQAFTAAAIFGTVGASAAVAGRMMPSSSTSGAGSGAATGSGSGTGSGADGSGSGGTGSGSQVPNVTVNIAGHVIGPSGAAQLCDIINSAVFGNDAQLYASHNPQGVPL